MTTQTEALAAALRPIVDHASSRMIGTRSDKIGWEKLIADAPEEIIAALLRAGFTVREIGGVPVVRISVTDTPRYTREVRAEADIPFPMTLWNEESIEMRSCTKDYAEHLAQLLARKMTARIEQLLGERIMSGLANCAAWMPAR